MPLVVGTLGIHGLGGHVDVGVSVGPIVVVVELLELDEELLELLELDEDDVAIL